MGVAPGIAGSPTPEEEGTFLVTDEWHVEWFAHMGLEAGHASVDVWAVTLPGESQPADEAEYPIVAEAIPPEALKLHRQDWTAREPSAVAGELFGEIYYGDGDAEPGTFAVDVVLLDDEGQEHRGVDALRRWVKRRAHGAPPPPEPKRMPDGTLLIETTISSETGFTLEGIDDERCLVSPLTEVDRWTVVRVVENLITEVREFRTRRLVSEEFPETEEP